VHPITDLESLSLPTQEKPENMFMTPTAVEGDGGAVGERVKIAKGHYVMLRDQVKDLAEDQELLPTPNTMEHREIKSPEEIEALKAKSPGGYRNLREVVINELPDDSLLRTSSVTDGTGGQ